MIRLGEGKNLRLIPSLLGVLLVLPLMVFILGSPQAIEEEPIVTGSISMAEVKLGQSDAIQQTLLATDDKMSGVVLFSPTEKLGRTNLQIKLYDQRGNELAQAGPLTRSEYRHDLWALFYRFPKIDLPPKSPLRLEVVNNGNSEVVLIINDLNYYAGGVFSSETMTGSQYDLSLSILHMTATSFGTKQGVLAGVMMLIGSVLIAIVPRYKWLLAGLLITFILPLAVSGFWFSTGDWGVSDWDLYFSMHEGYRRTVLDYGEFPFWNPYIYGGVSGLGDPEFAVFSFTFLAELILGVPLGFKAAIYIALVTSGLGMIALGKRIGLSVQASLLTAIVFPLSTTVLLKFVEGHIQHLAIAWIPWVFWSWYSAYHHNPVPEATGNRWRDLASARGFAPRASWKSFVKLPDVVRLRAGLKNPWIMITGLLLTVMFYQGGIYMLFYMIPALILFIWLAVRPRDALAVTVGAGFWSLGLSAFKLVPVMNWIREFPDDFYHVSLAYLPYWYEIYIRRNLHGATIMPNQGGGWHEYGAYIGPIVLGLLLLGCSQFLKRRVVKILMFGVVLTVLTAAAGPWLVPLFDVVTWLPRSNISRIALFAVFSGALLAGFGLDAIGKHSSGKGRYLVPIIVGLVATDIMSLSYVMSEQAFVVPAVVGPVVSSSPPITYSGDRRKIKIGDTDLDRTYASVLAGYGTLSYRPPLAPPLGVIPVSENDTGQYVTTVIPGPEVELVSWSPNTVEVRVYSDRETKLVLNSNYSNGWRVNGEKAIAIGDRLGAVVPAGAREFNFKYRPPGYYWGLIITLISLMVAVASVLWTRRK